MSGLCVKRFQWENQVRFRGTGTQKSASIFLPERAFSVSLSDGWESAHFGLGTVKNLERNEDSLFFVSFFLHFSCFLPRFPFRCLLPCPFLLQNERNVSSPFKKVQLCAFVAFNGWISAVFWGRYRSLSLVGEATIGGWNALKELDNKRSGTRFDFRLKIVPVFSPLKRDFFYIYGLNPICSCLVGNTSYGHALNASNKRDATVEAR